MSVPVTIIVCTYNDSEFLPRALESCVSQDADEIIVVDDGSTHEFSPNLWQMMREEGTTYVRHGRNAGLSAARNTGFTLARNEWVYPLDADDWLYPDALHKLHEAAVDSPWCHVVCGDISEAGARHFPPMSTKADKTGRCQATIEDWKNTNQGYAGSLVRKAAWEEVGGYHVLPHAHYEDYRLWNTLIKHFGPNCFKYVNALVYEHTPRPNSMLRQLHSRTQEFHKLATEPLR